MLRRVFAAAVGVYLALDALTVLGLWGTPVFAQHFVATICATATNTAANAIPLPDPAITEAIISVDTNGISWRADGVSPTVVSGIKVSAPGIIVLYDRRDILNFSWIGQTAPAQVCIQFAKP